MKGEPFSWLNSSARKNPLRLIYRIKNRKRKEVTVCRQFGIG